MTARRLRVLCALGAIAIVAGVGTVVASGHVRIVRHWSLYAASAPGQPYHLYLDPFPDARSCNRHGIRINRAGGRAYCGSRLVLSFDAKRESQLFWESIADPWSRICGPARPSARQDPVRRERRGPSAG